MKSDGNYAIMKDTLMQSEIELLRKAALEKVSLLSDEACSDILLMLKERGSLPIK